MQLPLSFNNFAVYLVSSNILPAHYVPGIRPKSELSIDTEVACAHIANYYNYIHNCSIFILCI